LSHFSPPGITQPQTVTLKPNKTMSILEIILAILLPPVAVFMRYGAGKDFVINLLLTIFLCGIGGVIHAFVVLSRKPSGPPVP